MTFCDLGECHGNSMPEAGPTVAFGYQGFVGVAMAGDTKFISFPQLLPSQPVGLAHPEFFEIVVSLDLQLPAAQ